MASQVEQLGLLCKLKGNKPNLHLIYSTEFIDYLLYTKHCVVSVLCQE